VSLRKKDSSLKNQTVGKILTSGLWSLTRHPNYFGNITMWWGFYMFCISGGLWMSIYGPIFMTLIVVKLTSGILENGLKNRPGYEKYMLNTSSFLPWFPAR